MGSNFSYIHSHDNETNFNINIASDGHEHETASQEEQKGMIDESNYSCLQKQLGERVAENDLNGVIQIQEQLGRETFVKILHQGYDRSVFHTCLTDSMLPILKYFCDKKLYPPNIMKYNRTPLCLTVQKNKNVTGGGSIAAIKYLCCRFWKTMTFSEFELLNIPKYLFLVFIYRLIFCYKCQNSDSDSECHIENKITNNLKNDINNKDLINSTDENFFKYCLTKIEKECQLSDTNNINMIDKYNYKKHAVIGCLYVLAKRISCDYRLWLLTQIHKTYRNCVPFPLDCNASDCNCDKDGNTLSHWCAKYESVLRCSEQFRCIYDESLAHLAMDPTITLKYNVHGWSPMHIACKYNSTIFIQVSARKIFPKADYFTVCENRMQTPLMIAIENYSFESIEILVNLLNCKINQMRDIGFYCYNELEYSTYYFIKCNCNDNDNGNTNVEKSLACFKLLFKRLLTQHQITNSVQLLEYNKNNDNWDKIDLQMIDSLIKIVNEYVNNGDHDENDYNQQLKSWLDILFLTFKNQDYAQFVSIVLNDTISSDKKIQDCFECPDCNATCTLLEQKLNHTSCVLCNSTTVEKETYQCSAKSNHLICYNCCFALTLTKLLCHNSIHLLHLFISFINQNGVNDEILSKMFNIDIVGKYYDVSTILFHVCKNVKYLEMSVIEKFIRFAPKEYSNKLQTNSDDFPWTHSTLMHIAAFENCLDLMTLLDKYHFNWSILSEAHESVFLMLCKQGNVDCMRLLWQHCNSWIDLKHIGAGFNMYNDQDEMFLDGLNWAVERNNEEMLKYLLSDVYVGDECRVLVNRLMRCDGKNALHRACVAPFYGTRISLFKLLIDIGGAECNIPDGEGHYPIHLTAGLSCYDCTQLKYCITNSMYPSINVKTQNDKQESPLMIAIKQFQYDKVRIICEFGKENVEISTQLLCYVAQCMCFVS